MSFTGFNVSLTVLGTNRTVRGLVSDLPASVLEAPSPMWGTDLQRLDLTLRLQGPNIVPFTAALQKEVVSALLHVRHLMLIPLCNSSLWVSSEDC